MMFNWRNSIGLIALVLLWISGLPVEAAGPEPIRLWPDGAPGAKGEAEHDVPLIRIYPAGDKATGTAVVILPGGGYGGLAMDHEGHQIAQFWNRLGVTGIVVTYRHGPHYQHPAPLQDAQRAVRYVRAHAQELNVDPHRVGVMGFSAGGHLASTVSTHFDEGDAESDDPVARQGSRPDFAVLCYPVITMQDPHTHQGSRRNLLGKQPDEKLVEHLSNHLQVTKKTPPTFVFHTAEDQAVPVENAILYYQALIENGVDAELHIYQKGRHGVGLAPNDPVLKSWPDRLADWVRLNGFLTDQKRAAVSGEVTVDGEPLTWGMISLTPDHAPQAPAVGAMVSRGTFSFSAQDGPIRGEHTVRIWNLGTFSRTPSIEDAHSIQPGRSLRVNVSEQNNEFQFELASK